ncbi:MAG TPA: AbrB/MazE/SpoVT family DNA-binding domain-containing protein [Gammaproteobacteria bacterium]|nr:AbrB/MazE/SpoVT family DNA-binding domain-containing protein [Gammaproteobacteria bacterium]
MKNALISTLTQKGQVTIPKEMRDSLRLSTGDKVEFVRGDQGEIIIKPVTRKVSEVAGMLGKYRKSRPVTVEEMNRSIARHIRNEFS